MSSLLEMSRSMGIGTAGDAGGVEATEVVSEEPSAGTHLNA